MREVFDRPGFFALHPPIHKAVDAIKSLMIENIYEIFFLTSPMNSNPTCASDKLAWISRVFGKKWARRTIITCDKTVVDGDWLIDDKPWCSTNGVQIPKWTHILCRAPNNKEFTSSTHAFILEDWDNLPNLLQHASK